MTAQQRRALYKFLEFFLATGVLATAYQYLTAPAIDWKALGAALLAAIVAAGMQWLKDGDPLATSPSVLAVNAALESDSNTVAQPKHL